MIVGEEAEDEVVESKQSENLIEISAQSEVRRGSLRLVANYEWLKGESRGDAVDGGHEKNGWMWWIVPMILDWK